MPGTNSERFRAPRTGQGRNMNLGKVVGTVVSTRKDEKLVGAKLQIVRQIDPEGPW